jgi:hypothetical protein
MIVEVLKRRELRAFGQKIVALLLGEQMMAGVLLVDLGGLLVVVWSIVLLEGMRKHYFALARHILAACLSSVQRAHCHRLRKNERGLGWPFHTVGKAYGEGDYPL